MRKLSKREKGGLVFILLLVIAGAYMLLFYKPMTSKTKEYTTMTDDLNAQMETITLQVSDYDKIASDLERFKTVNLKSIPEYDNIESLSRDLSEIIKRTSNYSITFSPIDFEEEIVKRKATITFSASSYDAAIAVIKMILNANYRCMIDNISINSGSDGGSVSASINVTYFEHNSEYTAPPTESVAPGEEAVS